MPTRTASFVLAVALLLFARADQAADRMSSAAMARKVLAAKGGERIATQMLDEIIAATNDVPDDVWQAVRKQMRPGDLIERLVPVYQRNLSDADLDALLRFYTSPAGKRYAEKQPVIVREIVTVEKEWGQRIVRQALADISNKSKDAAPVPPEPKQNAQSSKAHRFLEASGSGQEATQLVDVIVDGLRKARPDVRPDFWTALRARIHPQELIDLIAPVYQRNFSDEDLDALTRFFTSPAGVRFVQAQPVIVKESMEASRDWAEQLVEPALTYLLEHDKQLDEHSAEPGGSIRVAAERGDAKAQISLGDAYRFGKHGVAKSATEAVKWYRKAADQNSVAAEFTLATLYVTGDDGLARDPAEAAKWYRKAAEQGNRTAQRELAFVYQVGEGVPHDLAEAAKWYRKAAEQGDIEAEESLGEAYLKGEGVAADYAEAMKWYRKAAERGSADAQYELGIILLGDGKDPVEGRRWIEKAAAQKHVKAAEKLAALNAAQEPTPYEEPLLHSSGTGRYTGEPIDLHLRDAGLRGVFSMLAQATGLNIVMDSRARARVTGDFSGPWDEVLDTIVKSNGLTYKIQELTVVVGPKDSPLMDPDLLKSASDDEPISLTVEDASLNDIVETFAQMGVKIENRKAPRQGSVTVYVLDVPLRKVLRMVLASTGYTSTEHGGVITIQPLPALDRFAASATPATRPCWTPGCEDIADAKLRGTLTPQKSGAKSIALFEFTSDRYTISKAGTNLGKNARVVDTAAGRVTVTDLRTEAHAPMTFVIETIRSK